MADDDQQIIDAEEVSEDTATTEVATASDQATVMLSLEELIKNNVSSIDALKEELKKHRQMFSDTLTNDPSFREKEEVAKKAAKDKNALKKQLLDQPSMKITAQKIRDMSVELKDKSSSLSDYLLEYQRMSGVNEIEGLDGEVREIIHTAKLLKRSSPKDR